MRSLASPFTTLARRSVLGICLFSVPGKSSTLPQPLAASRTTVAGTSYFTSEVRLRKLHLVRPDLIPYPIHFEVYC